MPAVSRLTRLLVERCRGRPPLLVDEMVDLVSDLVNVSEHSKGFVTLGIRQRQGSIRKKLIAEGEWTDEMKSTDIYIDAADLRRKAETNTETCARDFLCRKIRESLIGLVRRGAVLKLGKKKPFKYHFVS